MSTLVLVFGIPLAIFLTIVVVVAILELRSDLDTESKSLIRKGLERANEDKSK